jgi:hypothetical protein
LGVQADGPALPVCSLVVFFAIAFGLGWGLVALLVLFTEQIEAIFGPVSGTNPLIILAVHPPTARTGLASWS